jgi:drug/metabolite transporter (DMT)-like permease
MKRFTEYVFAVTKLWETISRLAQSFMGGAFVGTGGKLLRLQRLRQSPRRGLMFGYFCSVSFALSLIVDRPVGKPNVIKAKYQFVRTALDVLSQESDCFLEK